MAVVTRQDQDRIKMIKDAIEAIKKENTLSKSAKNRGIKSLMQAYKRLKNN